MRVITGLIYLFALSSHLALKGQAISDDGLSILSGPASLNVSVNNEAKFSCYTSTLDLKFIKWFLNGNLLDDEKTVEEVHSFAMIDATTRRHDIAFQIQETNTKVLNQSNITCLAFYNNTLEGQFGVTNFSEPALLLIQGILNAPEILSTSVENGSVSMHWRKPFILKGIYHYYQLNITVKASLGPSDVLTENTTNQTNEEQSFFPEPFGGICNTYNICVQAVSAAGMGEPACTFNFSKAKKPQKLTNEEVDVQVAFMQGTFTSTYAFDQDYCLQRRTESSTLTANFRNNNPSLVYYFSTIHPDSDQQIKLLMTMSQAQSRVLDNVTIVLKNVAGSTESDPIKTDVSCIQSTSFLDDKSVVCLFVSGCMISGCKVVIECASKVDAVKQEPYVLNLTRKKDSLVSESGPLLCDSIANCTTNSILVYALYNDSHSDIPDVAHSNISINACSTFTTHGHSETVTMDIPVTPTQSSDQRFEAYMYTAVIAIPLCFLVLVCIVITICTVPYFRSKWRRAGSRTVVKPVQDNTSNDKQERNAADKCRLVDEKENSQKHDNTAL